MTSTELTDEIEKAREIQRKMVTDNLGIAVDKHTPITLKETLQARLAISLTQGVSYRDVMELRAHTTLFKYTGTLNPNNYPHERALVGLSIYQDTIRACLLAIHELPGEYDAGTL